MLKQLLLLAGLASVASSVACGGAASEDVGFTGSSEGALLAGTELTPSQVATYVRAAGFPESEVGVMVCIAKYESSFYERASHKNSNGTTDYGLFQINSVNLGSGKCASSGSAAYDPTTNAKCAREIYEGQGVDAWYAYKSHKTTCENYPAPGSSDTADTVTAPSTGSSSGSASGSSASGSTTTTGSSATSAGSSAGSTSGSSGSTTAGSATTGDDDDSGDDSSSSGSSSGSSGSAAPSGTTCWSSTLGESVAQDACVNSAFDGTDEQCIDGSWYSGVSNGVGPDGACTSQN